MDLAIIAGTVSTVLFATSNLPMLIKAVRTRDMASYSLGNLALSNVGNAVHSIYVYSLPAGPIWALHSFYVVAAALMLIWYLRFGHRRPSPAEPAGPVEPAGLAGVAEPSVRSEASGPADPGYDASGMVAPVPSTTLTHATALARQTAALVRSG